MRSWSCMATVEQRYARLCWGGGGGSDKTLVLKPTTNVQPCAKMNSTKTVKACNHANLDNQYYLDENIEVSLYHIIVSSTL